MPSAAFDWNIRIKAIEREYQTVRLAINRLAQQARDEVTILGGRLRLRDVVMSSDRLEGTYLIRLFAEFEAGLRQFMRALKYRIPKSTEALLNRVKDRTGIPKSDAAEAHAVREYRNMLVHDQTLSAAEFSMREATKILGKFMGWLQRYW